MAASVSKKRASGKRQPTIRVYHSGRLIDCEEALRVAAAKLAALDPEVIPRLVEIGGPPPLRRR